MRILLVEDEAEMATALSSALRRYDMVVDHAPTLADAEEAISADVHAAALLDRQLPDGDGLALIPKLRARADGVPIIVLTARGELADRIAGLDSGADDYLAKPFAVEELLAAAACRAAAAGGPVPGHHPCRPHRLRCRPSRGQHRRPAVRAAAP
ncbi:DNA-binding response OmpR family regulator [Bradyrhizobium sp. GM24.11]